ncbi:hypothetical protein O181_008558 [Austropuccinia psidii MF-1]|uniref:Uncharacterized protein n=1 Tax=Austropuccinia psidii MF-1 TaxID=1389203 RepID=A0A9Q3BPD1_9BASI|nr:hypothetical protein [Austropuccinia psidii MF-1]
MFAGDTQSEYSVTLGPAALPPPISLPCRSMRKNNRDRRERPNFLLSDPLANEIWPPTERQYGWSGNASGVHGLTSQQLQRELDFERRFRQQSEHTQLPPPEFQERLPSYRQTDERSLVWSGHALLRDIRQAESSHSQVAREERPSHGTQPTRRRWSSQLSGPNSTQNHLTPPIMVRPQARRSRGQRSKADGNNDHSRRRDSPARHSSWTTRSIECLYDLARSL